MFLVRAQRWILLAASLWMLCTLTAADEYQLKPGVMQRMMGAGASFSLPQMRLYNGEGYLLKEAHGYVQGRLPDLLNKAMEAGAKADSSRSLIGELADLQSSDGETPPLPKCAEFYIVKYWAEWCKPCHLLDDELDAYMEQHPELSLEVYSVEADPDMMALEESPAPANP
jgi:thiol-disulfide isomerase/thioredoxin